MSEQERRCDGSMRVEEVEDTFSPGWMFRPRDRRIDTLGLRGWEFIFTSATLSPPCWVGESGSLQVDVALDGVELEPGRGVAVDLWLPIYHLKDSLGLQMCSNQVDLVTAPGQASRWCPSEQWQKYQSWLHRSTQEQRPMKCKKALRHLYVKIRSLEPLPGPDF